MDDSVKAAARAGVAASAVGIVLNALLAAAKIAAGALCGLVSVCADGFNNLSDCGASAVTLVSFRISAKPADREHPFGHRRAEYVASVIIGCIIIFLAAELLNESAAKIFGGGVSGGSAPVYILLGASVAVKAGLAVYYFCVAKRTGSGALKAAGVDSVCDCAATAAVIAGLLAGGYAGIPADGWAGAAVALFIVWQGAVILKDASSQLLGKAPDAAFTDGIKRYLLSDEKVLGVHDLRVYSYGRDASFGTVHIEMDCRTPPLEAHAVIDGLEHGVAEKFGVSLTAHLDPVDTLDGEARELGARLGEELKGIDPGLKIHDFRMVRGVKPQLIFDVSVSYDAKLSDGEIYEAVCGAVREKGYLPVVTVDRE